MPTFLSPEVTKRKMTIFTVKVFCNFSPSGCRGKIKAPSCFSCRDSSNHMRYDLKRSIWNLTWGQGQPKSTFTYVGHHSMRLNPTNRLVQFPRLFLNLVKCCWQKNVGWPPLASNDPPKCRALTLARFWGESGWHRPPPPRQFSGLHATFFTIGAWFLA